MDQANGSVGLVEKPQLSVLCWIHLNLRQVSFKSFIQQQLLGFRYSSFVLGILQDIVESSYASFLFYCYKYRPKILAL